MSEKIGELRFYAALDNYEPARDETSGVAEVFRRPSGEDVIRIAAADSTFKDAYQALYLLDDGSTVVPHYVAGYNPTNDPGAVFLQPMPTNPDGRTRPDGRVIDYRTWCLGPKRAYHLKITRL